MRSFNEPSFSEIVSPRKPFGFSNPWRIVGERDEGAVKVYAHPKSIFTVKEEITQNRDEVAQYKVFIAKAYGERGNFPYNVLSKPFVGEPNSCSTETYLLVKAGGDLNIAENIRKYISTKFFRFFVLLKKNTQNAPRGVYEFVPKQDFSDEWTDEKLFDKYGLNQSEISYITSLVKDMELS